MRSWPWLRIGLLPSLVIAIGVAVAFRDRIDPTALEAWIAGFGMSAPLAFVAVYALASPIPTTAAGLPRKWVVERDVRQVMPCRDTVDSRSAVMRRRHP